MYDTLASAFAVCGIILFILLFVWFILWMAGAMSGLAPLGALLGVGACAIAFVASVNAGSKD